MITIFKHLQQMILVTISSSILLIAALFFSTNIAYAADFSAAKAYFNKLFSNHSQSQVSGSAASVPQPARFESHSESKGEQDNSPEGIGKIADNLMGPVHIVAGFITSTAIVIGMTCLFAGFIRYMQHRVNPLAHPISTVVTLVILGTVLLCLPLVYKLTESGVAFSLD